MAASIRGSARTAGYWAGHVGELHQRPSMPSVMIAPLSSGTFSLKVGR